MFKQLNHKPVKLGRFLKHNKPKERNVGRAEKRCRRCHRVGGHVGKYGLGLCRHCFREIASKIGFRKYS
ncbi:30S ribosomal protein S14 [Candidatus Woesearchaeota archaeon]|nr:30S ribosomal protein S14 [Candidatus Woesearchaeota archaeon]